MDGTNVLSDAEMRLITVNGQTIMLEGDFENINMTNEFLNEMLMVSDSEVDISDRCSVEINENSCVNGVKGSDEPQKLEISIQGDNNELETVQIGVEEAKALGLYFYGCKDDENNSWNCTLSGNQEETVKDEEKVSGNSEGETCKVKLHSVPVVSVGCLDREPETLLFVNEVTKLSETCGTNADSFPFSATARAEKIGKPIQEENTENLPAIGHLEGFQIPTSEDGLLLPTTVNAKMVDGSYQTITLVPQIANGAVTYTVHFSNLSREIMDKNLNNLTSMKESETFSNVENSVNKEIINNEINSVEEFLSSVQSIKNNQAKKFCQGNMQRHSDNKISVTGFVNSLTEDSVLKINQNNQSVETGKDVSVSYMHQNQLPIDAKIDNLISENENVISRCKKVKYGKKVKSMDTEPLTGTIKVTKSNITKAKKVKFKNKGFKFLSDELEQKKLKLSLLKPNNGHKLESTDKKGLETTKAVNTNLMPHMNLNGRLEYPNLKAIDETASLPYLKMKSQQATKQPYFNVLPYPKDKTIPVQKQILPLNCDLQQAKNLISLQKFLETQKLQLKIQPIVSNGNKIINIRPKPTMNEEVKVFTTDIPSKHVLNKLKEKHLSCDIPREGGIHKTQEQESAKKSYQENLNVKDVLLSDGKLNNLKFLKSHNSNSEGDDMKEFPSDCTNKLSGIFIKNNPEYFSQKFKDGKSDEHPLGSSENPIQLVQTGHTFHR